MTIINKLTKILGLR